MQGPGARPAAAWPSARPAAIRPTSTSPGATAKGIPVLHAPGRNADGVAEIAVALLLAVNRHLLPADRDVRAGRGVPGRHHPLPALPGVAARRAHRRPRRPRRGRPGHEVAARGPRHAGDLLRPLQPPTPPTTRSTSCWPRPTWSRCTRASTAETLGMMGADQFARMRDGAIYLNSARAGLHDLDALTAALQSGKLAGAGLDHFEGEMLPLDHPLVAMDNVVLTPHIGGATYDTEANHTTTDRRRLRSPAERRPAAALRQPGGAAMTATADEVKAEVLAVAQEDATQAGLVDGTAGNISGKHARRHRVHDAVVAPVRGDDASTTSSSSTSTATRSGAAAVPTTEKALHLGCYQRYPEVGGVIHSPRAVRLDVRARARADPGGDRGGRRLHRRRRPVLRLQDHRHRRAGRRGGVEARPTGRAALMANHGLVCIGKSPEDALHAALVVERTAEIVWGAAGLGAPRPPPRQGQRQLRQRLRVHPR